MYRYGLHAHHPFIGILFLLLVAALVALAVVGVYRLTKGRPAHAGTAPMPSVDPALVELRMRYARGEISSDEYRLRAGDLGYQVPPGPVPTADPSTAPSPPPRA